MNRFIILLGSNIDKETNMPRAVQMLRKMCLITAVSPVYETVPVGLLDQPNFLNAAVQVESERSALELKDEVLIVVEERLRRVRQGNKNAPRTIDADIVLCNDDVFDYDNHHIPDPDLLKFPHVAVPVADLVPDMPHPETAEPISAIARRLLVQTTRINDGAPPLWKRTDVELSR